MPLTAAQSETVKSRLSARREELLKRHRRVEGDLARAAEPLVADFADQAVQVQNDEALEVIGRAAREEIEQIDAALERLDQGRYGICVECNSPIDPARLAAVPYATACSVCFRD